MKPINVFFRALLITAVLTAAALGTPDKSAALETAKTPSIPLYSLETLEGHFRKAMGDIEKKAYSDAATQIRAASNLIEKEAQQSKADVRKVLTKSAQELQALAKRMESDLPVSTKEMRQMITKAYRAMAESSHGKASESLSKKALSETAGYLKAAAEYLEKAWLWSGRVMEKSVGSAIDSAKALGSEILAGSKHAADEITTALEDLGTGISKLIDEAKASGEPLKMTPLQPVGSAVSRTDLSTAISKVADSTIPAVVQIRVTERREVPNPFLPFEGNPFFRHFFNLPKKMPKKFKEEMVGLGTGMIVDSSGHILTNNHVVGGATEIKVLMSNGEEYPAKLVGTDPKTDLGVIKISTGKALPHVKFGNSDDVSVGQWVVAIGHPRGLDQTVTQGIISAKHRAGITDPSSYQDFLQTDAAINPGNSGGPLLTLDGLVIGVNSAIATQSGGFEGIGFAIPSKMAVHIANALILHGKVERGWLGVSVQDITPDLAKAFGLDRAKGALIADVMKGGPAEKSGLKRGDVVLDYEGASIDDGAGLRNMVANTPAGKAVKMIIWRDKKRLELNVTVGNLEQLSQKLAAVVKERLGVQVAPVSAEEAANYGLPAPQGVSIHWVDTAGPLGKLGFEVGDLILAIENHPVAGVESFVTMVNALPPHKKVTFLALDHRSGQTSYVQVEVN